MLLNWSACALQRDVSSSSRTDSVLSHVRLASDSVYVLRSRWVQNKGDTVFVRDTLFRERFLTKQHADTVYAVRHVEVQLPPVRYVPRFYKVSAVLAAVLLLFVIGRVVLRLLLRCR